MIIKFGMKWNVLAKRRSEKSERSQNGALFWNGAILPHTLGSPRPAPSYTSDKAKRVYVDARVSAGLSSRPGIEAREKRTWRFLRWVERSTLRNSIYTSTPFPFITRELSKRSYICEVSLRQAIPSIPSLYRSYTLYRLYNRALEWTYFSLDPPRISLDSAYTKWH